MELNLSYGLLWLEPDDKSQMTTTSYLIGPYLSVLLFAIGKSLCRNFMFSG